MKLIKMRNMAMMHILFWKFLVPFQNLSLASNSSRYYALQRFQYITHYLILQVKRFAAFHIIPKQIPCNGQGIFTVFCHGTILIK